MDHRLTCKTIKCLGKKKTGENLWDLGLGKKFLGFTPKTWSIKRKTNKLASSKLKTSALAKGCYDERQATDTKKHKLQTRETEKFAN